MLGDLGENKCAAIILEKFRESLVYRISIMSQGAAMFGVLV